MNPSPNLFAVAFLLSWPIVTLLLFASFPTKRAIVWTFVGAQLLLPFGTILKFEGIPALDKTTVPNVAALLACLLLATRPRVKFRFGVLDVLVLIYVSSPFITAFLNSDSLSIGGRFLPEEGYYDALSAASTQLIAIAPLYIARVYLSTPAARHEILVATAVSSLLYCAPLLFEIRMSPQLHLWIYGYQSSDFEQAMRAGGFRPMVFMGHPLLAAFYLMMGIVSATAIWKMGRQRLFGMPSNAAPFLLGLVLVLCKSLASICYTALGILLVTLTSPKFQMRFAKTITIIALTYPVLRFSDVFPTRTLVDFAHTISDERAVSLQFRFENEDMLMNRAKERPVFGWGRFGRNRVYDPDTGKDIAVTDGRWIITLGQFGIVGFLAEFGLLATAVFRAASLLAYPSSPADRIGTSALAFLLAMFILNLLPNSALIPLAWLIAGSLANNRLTSRAAWFTARRRSSNNASLSRSLSVNSQSP